MNRTHWQILKLLAVQVRNPNLFPQMPDHGSTRLTLCLQCVDAALQFHYSFIPFGYKRPRDISPFDDSVGIQALLAADGFNVIADARWQRYLGALQSGQDLGSKRRVDAVCRRYIFEAYRSRSVLRRNRREEVITLQIRRRSSEYIIFCICRDGCRPGYRVAGVHLLESTFSRRGQHVSLDSLARCLWRRHGNFR